MKKRKSSAGILYKTFKHLFLFSILALVFSFVMSIWVLEKPILLPVFVKNYIIANAFLFFISIFHILQLGTFLFSFSILFSKMDDENSLERFTAMRFYLKALIKILTVVFIINVFLFEFEAPFLRQKMDNFEMQTKIYKHCLFEAKKLRNVKQMHENKLAINFAKQALDINPDSKEAKLLLEALTLIQSEFAKIPPTEPKLVFPAENVGVKGFLDLAEQAMERLDFFSAHYFASRAMELINSESDEYEEAQQILLSSWNSIENGDDTLLKKNRQLYEKKFAAYSALKQGLYLKAYKLFYELKRGIKEEYDDAIDIQLNYFLAKTKEKLSKRVFYYEDLEKVGAFKSLNNFSFEISEGRSKFFKIEADGFSYRKPKENFSNNKNNFYLKNVSLIKYDYANQISWKQFAKYARLVPNFNDTGLTLQLTMISENQTMPNVVPKVLIGKISEGDLLSQELPIGTEEFLLILENQNTKQGLDLIRLYELFKKSKAFGLDKSIFLQEIIFNIAKPLILFVVSMALASLSWNFRFDYNHLTFGYLLVLPAIFLLAMIILEIAVFIAKILLKFYLFKFSNFAIVLTILTWCLFSVFYALKFYRCAKN